ncbi:TetR/AcrR family transcriptional regulator [Dactylosporangium siamense]|uniref:TetR family transcriptional regulator n=1 Tax=Dactylosporangium siamense TaxID=685454 RepID=A0A919PWZ8_9ACTN|nr:TetR/AcrR family transcriptional regulator [Dactylosporangium siamense]GIG51844.1 TetR family transcriptional regulator [Dactylosporangium siamense]
MAHVNEARLVDEAARLLVEHGPAGLSLRKVAAAAGVSTMPVYTLFGDKEGLLAAMHREGFRRLGAALAAVPATAEPLADLIELGLAYRRAALSSPHLYGLMFGRTVPQFQPSGADREAADATYQPLVDAVARCQAAGVFGGGDPRRVALHLWAVSHGMVNLELNGQLPELGSAEDLYLEALGYAGLPFLAVG